ncbi:MAG: hypothetical protein GYB64_20530 [Chloroflexi bacterium]|nr:hypothetical protein [Chloroflexota bacterium]
MDFDNPHVRKWFTLAPLGLLLIGAGVSFIGEATIRKQDDRPWFLLGTVGLVLLNAGLSVFGDAVKERFFVDLQERGLL